MKKFIHPSLMLVFIFLLCSCAQSYYSLNPTRIGYNAYNNPEDITLNYRYDILNEAGNKKMSKKEKAGNIKLVAVKITNNTAKVINIGNNAAFYSNNSIASIQWMPFQQRIF